MKNKIILIIISVFILAGCSAKYELKIDKDFINENLSVTETNYTVLNNPCYESVSITCKERINSRKREIVPSFYEERLLNPDTLSPNKIYNITINNSSEGMGFAYDYKFKINNYNSSNIARSCIDNFEVTREIDGTIKVSASGYFRCEYNYLDEVYVEVTSDYYTIVDSNAKSRKNDKHIWKIDLQEKNDIHFKLRDDSKQKASLKLIKWLLIFIVTVLIVSLIVGVIKNKKNNNI